MASRNYRLVKNKESWVFLGKDEAFDSSYASRFENFLKSSDDKEREKEALIYFTKQFIDTNLLNSVIDKEIKFIDIGAGDGMMALPILQLLNQDKNVKYIAIDRDPIFSEHIEEMYRAEKISHVFYEQDFREILPDLALEKAHIALASHLYTTTPIEKFISMVFDVLDENSFLMMVHNTANSDATQFRGRFDYLNLGNFDYAKAIDNTLKECELNAITFNYESSLTFPYLEDSDWDVLKTQIHQAAYETDYSNFSHTMLVAKQLIEFIISDRLEAFNERERNEVLDQLRAFAEERNYKFKNMCRIQVVLSPKHSLECKRQFMQLKNRVEENDPSIAFMSNYPGTLFTPQATTSTSRLTAQSSSKMEYRGGL